MAHSATCSTSIRNLLAIMVVLATACDPRPTIELADTVGPEDTSTDFEDRRSCPDGLEFLEEFGLCAPPLHLCPSPWEMPTVGGECVVVGPRACAEAEAGCEPGDLLDCPEGFALTEDEAACVPFFEEACLDGEMPLFGGGCRTMGPAWYDPEAPDGGLQLDGLLDCAPNQVMHPDGSCVQIGPRTCPKLFNPDSEVDCQLGELLSCQDGWTESDDGLSCEPVYDDCPAGQRPTFGGGCQAPVSECPDGTFPDVVGLPDDAVYVKFGSPCLSDCGTKDAPFPDIVSGLDAVGPGGHLVIGAGIYTQGLLIDKPVHIHGLCAGKVKVAGQVALLFMADKLSFASLAVVDTQDVTIAGLTLNALAAGIVVTGSTGIQVQEVEFEVTQGLGLFAGEHSEVSASNLWVHDIMPGAEGMGGVGIHVENGSTVSVNTSLVETVRAAGVRVVGPETQLVMSDSTVRNTQSAADGSGGFAVSAESGAEVSLSRLIINGNRGAGVHAVSNALLDLSHSVVAGTVPDDASDFGYGVQAGSGADVTVLGTVVDGNSGVGCVAHEPGTTLQLRGSVVRDTKANKLGNFGQGVYAHSMAAVEVSGSLLEGNRTSSATVAHAGSVLELLATIVRSTLPDEYGASGWGLEASEEGMATVTNCVIQGNTRAGLTVFGNDTSMSVDNSIVRSNLADSAGELGCGIHVTEGAQTWISNCAFEANAEHGISASVGAAITVSNSLVQGNVGAGIIAADPGTKLNVSASRVRDTWPEAVEGKGYGISIQEGAEATVQDCLVSGSLKASVVAAGADTRADLVDCVIRDTLFGEFGVGGYGFEVSKGAQVTVSGGLFDGNCAAAVMVAGAGTEVVMSDTVLRNTEADGMGERGYGLLIQEEAAATVSGSLIDRNQAVGVVIGESGAWLELENTVIRDTQPDGAGRFGLGLSVKHQGQASLLECLLAGNRDIGIVAAGPAVSVEMTGTVVRNTSSNGDGSFGRGLDVSSGALLTVTDSLVEANRQCGILVSLPGTFVILEGTTIRDTLPDDNGHYGLGMRVQDDAGATVSGCLFDRNTEAGIVIDQAAEDVWLSGTIVRRTVPGTTGNLGLGVAALAGTQLLLEKTLIQDNATSGLLAWDPATSVEVADCAIMGTLPGGRGVPDSPSYEAFGDGVATHEASIALQRTLVTGNGRAGVYYNQGLGSLTGSLVTGNASFGLALADCDEAITYLDKTNFIFGNALDLPPAQAADISTSPEGLPSPPIPEASGLAAAEP